MKISDKYPLEYKNPHVIELNDDFAINGAIYNKYTLQQSDLNFFLINSISDCYHLPINNLSCKLNNYSLHRCLLDNVDSDIIYIINQINFIDYVYKIYNNNHNYKIISTVKISALEDQTTYTTTYYTKQHLEFVGQTKDYIILYDNYELKNISKSNFSLRVNKLRQPLYLSKIENELFYFIDSIYSKYTVYDPVNNTISNIDIASSDDITYKYSWAEGSTKYPIIDNKFFSQSFEINNYINTNDYNTNSYTKAKPPSTGAPVPQTYLVKFNLLDGAKYSNSSNLDIWVDDNRPWGLTQLFFNNGDTYYKQVNWFDNRFYSPVPPKAVKHKITNKNIYFYNNNNDTYTLTTTDSNGFNKFYIEKFDDNLLIIHNGNSVAHLILLNQNLEVLINYEWNFPFQICCKYNKNYFCMILNNTFFMYKLDIENSTIIEVYTVYGIDSFSINNNNIWTFNNQKFELLTQGTPQDLSVNFEQETYEYQDVYINSYVQIYAKNFLSEYLNINVKLTLSGPCIFENNSNVLITNTGNSITTVPVIIRGADKCTCSIEEV